MVQDCFLIVAFLKIILFDCAWESVLISASRFLMRFVEDLLIWAENQKMRMSIFLTPLDNSSQGKDKILFKLVHVSFTLCIYCYNLLFLSTRSGVNVIYTCSIQSQYLFSYGICSWLHQCFTNFCLKGYFSVCNYDFSLHRNILFLKF